MKTRNIWMALTLLLTLLSSVVWGQDWKVGNHDLSGSRSIPSSAQSGLTKEAVEAQGLEVRWFAATDHAVQSVPAVHDGAVYVGTADNIGGGSVYAIDAETGATLWNVGAAEGVIGGVLASPLISGNNVYIGTLEGTLHALKKQTGEVIWSYKPSVGGFFDAIWSGPIQIRNMIVFTINPQDEVADFDPPGISAVIAVDAENGAQTPADEIWRFTPVPASLQGDVGGAGIWGTSPSYSRSLDLIFVSTGQNTFSRDGMSSPGSDSVFAIDATTGDVRWQNQVKAGDIWNFSKPFDPTDPRDTDVGEAPAVFKSRGREYVAVGSKRGYFYIMDANTGEIQNGSGMDSLGFSRGLDLFVSLPGPGTNGGFNLDSGYFKHGNEVTHFGILHDYTSGLTAVASGVFPWDGSGDDANGQAGVCFIAGFGFDPECPTQDFAHLILMNEDGTAEIGRYSNPGAPIFSPVYLDDMIVVHEAADFATFDNNKLLVIDVSNPSNPTLMETVELIDSLGARVFSLGAQVSISNGRIYTGNGFFGFNSLPGLFSIGLTED